MRSQAPMVYHPGQTAACVGPAHQLRRQAPTQVCPPVPLAAPAVEIRSRLSLAAPPVVRVGPAGSAPLAQSAVGLAPAQVRVTSCGGYRVAAPAPVVSAPSAGLQHAVEPAAAAQLQKAALLEAQGDFEGALAAYRAPLLLQLPRAVELRNLLAIRALRERLAPCAGDVFVATFPKSGTTWVQQIVCLLLGEPSDVSVERRAPWLEAVVSAGVHSLASLATLPQPRVFKTHTQWANLPVRGCTSAGPPPGVRVIAVVRDPRDVMVSLYYHSRAIKGISYGGSWDSWFELYMTGKAPIPAGTSLNASSTTTIAEWFAHTLGWWRIACACPGQVLFLTYEEITRDPVSAVRRIASLLFPQQQQPASAASALEAAAPLSFEAIQRVVEQASFDKMRQREEQSGDRVRGRHEGEAGHFRKGEVGDWKNHFSAEQSDRFDGLLRSWLAGTGLEAVFELGRQS